VISTGLLAVWLARHVFLPVHYLSVEAFLNGNVRDRRGGCRPMPVLFAGGEPDRVTAPDLLNRIVVEGSWKGYSARVLTNRGRVGTFPTYVQGYQLSWE
jgi:hypothetical protein